jgi:hypothetical protein
VRCDERYIQRRILYLEELRLILLAMRPELREEPYFDSGEAGLMYEEALRYAAWLGFAAHGLVPFAVALS